MRRRRKKKKWPSTIMDFIKLIFCRPSTIMDFIRLATEIVFHLWDTNSLAYIFKLEENIDSLKNAMNELKSIRDGSEEGGCHQVTVTQSHLNCWPGCKKVVKKPMVVMTDKSPH